MAARLTFSVAIVAGLAASAAFAQDAVKPQPRDPNMPAPHNTVPEKMEPRAGETTGSTNNLSEKLRESDGVIRPPDTGAGLVTPGPVPNPGTTPVIPPAGTPGSSRPNVDPR